MFLGLGLSLIAPQPAADAGPPFDPATLTSSGLWLPDFGGSPWPGTSSAGDSGGRNLSEATNPPSVGTPVGGRTPAHFDGTNDKLSYATTSDLITTTSLTIAAFAKADAPPADPGAGNRSGVPLIYGVYFGLGITSTGVCAFGFDGGYKDIHVAADTSGRVFVQMKIAGGNLYVRANKGAWSAPVAIGTLSGTSFAFEVGTGNLAVFGGDVFGVASWQTEASDEELDGLYDYLTT